MQRYCAILLLFCLFSSRRCTAEDYPASIFGIKSDGVSLNTKSIQYAIDYINNKGGGRLVFSVGRYLTGSIHLKSNVCLQLEEGAAILGSLNPLDYEQEIFTALIFADRQHNISITGEGMIDGQGRQVALALVDLIHAGIIDDPLRNDRPRESIRPMLIDFRSCEHILMEHITLKNAASWVETYDQCRDLTIDSITVDSRAYWNNDGIDIVDCDSVYISHCHIDAADDGICLKSHDASQLDQHILIEHNVIRSSASAIKFGTASLGGFKHVKILSNRVFDTYRSALAIEAVDGGSIEDIIVDSLTATNTGNAIFLRVGERVTGKKSRLDSISISNLEVQIPLGKPDSGYAYEGPMENQPRNVSPAIVIAGLPDAPVTNITLRNIRLFLPGGGNPFIAGTGIVNPQQIPEKAGAYPEFSMFGELPAWAMFIRHARNVKVSSSSFTRSRPDYRVAIVLDDVHGADLIAVTLKPLDNKKKFLFNNVSAIKTQ